PTTSGCSVASAKHPLEILGSYRFFARVYRDRRGAACPSVPPVHHPRAAAPLPPVLPLLTASRALILQQSSTRRNARAENAAQGNAEHTGTDDSHTARERDWPAGGLRKGSVGHSSRDDTRGTLRPAACESDSLETPLLTSPRPAAGALF